MIFVILTNRTLNVFLPSYYVLAVRRERLSQLDITRRRWCMALLVSVDVSVLSWPQLQEQVGGQQPHVDLAPLLLANGLVPWEPYFVYGWLQLRVRAGVRGCPGDSAGGGVFRGL